MSEHIESNNDQKPQQQNTEDGEIQSEDLEDVSGGVEDIDFNWNCPC